MAEPASFDEALQALAEELGREQPIAKRTLDRPQVRAGQLPYMPAPAASAPRAELRNSLSPEADNLMGVTGLPPSLGPTLDTGIKLGRAVGDAASGPFPWAYKTGEQLGEAASRIQAPDLIDKASAADGQPDKLSQLLEAQQLLQRQAEEARQRREGFRPKGRAPSPQSDPQYSAADAEFRQLSDRLGAVGKAVDQEQKMNSPEYRLQMEKQAQLDSEDQKKREAAMPWRERNPAWANALPNYAMAIASGVPGMIGAARNIRTFFPGSTEGQMRSAIAENLLARNGGNAATAKISEAELRNLMTETPQGWKNKLAKEAGEAGMAAGAGGALAAEAAMFPDQWDAYNLPQGTPAQARAKETALNPLAYVERAGMGALTGLSGYEIGSKLTPWKGAQTAKARAITENPYEPPVGGGGPSSPGAGGAPRDVPQLPPQGGALGQRQSTSEPQPSPSRPTFPGSDIPLPAGVALNSRDIPYRTATGHPLKKDVYTAKETDVRRPVRNNNGKSEANGKANEPETASEKITDPSDPAYWEARLTRGQ